MTRYDRPSLLADLGAGIGWLAFHIAWLPMAPFRIYDDWARDRWAAKTMKGRAE